MKKYISELIGTYGLVFCGTGAIVINDVSGGSITHPGIAITFGLIVMAMIYTFGEISGAHMNPAVTIAFWFAKRFSGKQVLPYIIAQLVGALAASFTLKMLFPSHITLGATLPSGDIWQTFVIEIILTFFLMLVIMHVSTGSKEIGNLAGMAIGATVLLEAMFAGPITGASMNPARSLAPALASGQLQHFWVYILAPVIGASLAILLCRFLNTDKECC
ncbi:MIP/aquaporin family protein [Fulvivirga ligni]|uniref:MIP/aquaporin family protein n=1 Tax=Fulvivirga ligni TaxID=2904246 RepID=UPI001F1F55C7|nr:MIP family channel protein [Fulvivirga ligni]UII20753.1 MIP family channel protein [Fulvivirga ligni]